MSTAVAPGMARAHGFRGAGKGNQRPDSEELERNHNGFYADEEEVGREELRELEEALSDASSIGAASSDSSSIGEDSSSEKEEEEDVESEAKAPVDEVLAMGLGTLESLEDALPSKRGLSNFYAGKSKSFTSLAEAAAKAAAKEIAKPENPFNKRRRVLAAWSRRRASCSSLVTTYLPPLLSLDHTVVEGDENEEEEEEEDRSEEDDGDDEGNGSGKGRREKAPASPRFPPPRRTLHSASQKASVMSRNMNLPNTSSFRSPRSFSLSDLQNAGYN
ncbi:transcription initiation factor TFIID subunit 7-like [Hordeum vulgare subsp. vulgare]|uniref:Uncharacterized protein n=1 Tax=Hordeum vulgare subsp. vulgare TaxID=112509 RepID=A0A8I6YEG7_HORVV|nr:transcription initiation factor TFIID subunit 7-like [Hordeum vulgare subsp. vulgare]KAI4974887.1 hypothetical protein ZWY2020_048494 [Hordeum vulgare]